MFWSILTKHKSGSAFLILVHKYLEFIQASYRRFDTLPKGQEKCNSCDASFTTTQLTNIISWFPSKCIELEILLVWQLIIPNRRTHFITSLFDFIGRCIILTWNHQHIDSFLFQVNIDSTQKVVCSTDSSEILGNSFFDMSFQLMQN